MSWVYANILFKQKYTCEKIQTPDSQNSMMQNLIIVGLSTICALLIGLKLPSVKFSPTETDL